MAAASPGLDLPDVTMDPDDPAAIFAALDAASDTEPAVNSATSDVASAPGLGRSDAALGGEAEGVIGTAEGGAAG